MNDDLRRIALAAEEEAWLAWDQGGESDPDAERAAAEAWADVVEFVRIDEIGLAEASIAAGVKGPPPGVDGRFWALGDTCDEDYSLRRCHDLPRVDRTVRAAPLVDAGRVLWRDCTSETDRTEWSVCDREALVGLLLRARNEQVWHHDGGLWGDDDCGWWQASSVPELYVVS